MIDEILGCFLSYLRQLLLRAGAAVDVVSKKGDTPLRWTLDKPEYVELLLDAGAKLPDPKSVTAPSWAVALASKRARCKACALALYGVLRKRWVLPSSSVRVPRDVLNMLTRRVWETRSNLQWVQGESADASKKTKSCNHRCSNKGGCGHACCKR